MSKHCYLCGVKLIKNHNKSKDHVPPDCIFPDDKPPNLITIPCCKDCNQKYDPLDEKMRNYIAILADEKSLNVGEKAKKVVLTSKKLSEQFLACTKQHPTMVDKNGNSRLFFYFKEDELHKWLIRVVKGLYFNSNKTMIDEHSIFKVGILSQLKPQLSDTFPMEKGLELRPYFVYGVVKIEDKLNSECWVLIFYDDLIFTVTVEMPVYL